MRMHNAAIQKRWTEGHNFREDAVLCRSISFISLWMRSFSNRLPFFVYSKTAEVYIIRRRFIEQFEYAKTGYNFLGYEPFGRQTGLLAMGMGGGGGLVRCIR